MQRLMVLGGLLIAAALAACGESSTGSGHHGNDPGAVRSGQGDVLAANSVITLPIEVLGPTDTIRTVSVPLRAEDVAAGGLKIALQAHNLSYDDKGSIKINDSNWIPLRNDTVAVAEPGKSYGGIGGGFHTLKLTVDVPAGAAVAGTNTIDFKFNGTDGVSIGYRVLRLNVLGANGQPLLPDALFAEDDPNTWTPPETSAEKIAEGKNLWFTANLSNPKTGALRAHCTDCHARDGRDLHYFNYSNTSIIERAKFHGLDEAQGKLIASYIRARPAPEPAHNPYGYPNLDPHPGRPWNPPFQPGPGVDARPFNEWSAGAGVDRVLDSDPEMMPYLFPNGINDAAVSRDANVNTREIPIAIQFPDWNHWLPHVHPLDARVPPVPPECALPESDWDASLVRKHYDGGGIGTPVDWNMRDVFRASLEQNHATLGTDRRYPEFVSVWNLRVYNFVTAQTYPDGSSCWTTEQARKIYDTVLWFDVKTWELVQEFQLEGKRFQGQASDREFRSWIQSYIFDTAPHLLHLPRTMSGIHTRPGNDVHNNLMWTYFSSAWYQMQLVAHVGNHADGQGRSNQRPVDWGYAYGFLKDLPSASGRKTPLMFTLYLTKGFQATDNTSGLAKAAGTPTGWTPVNASAVFYLGYSWIEDWRKLFDVLTTEDRIRIYDVLVKRWFDKTRSFSVEELNTSGFAPRDIHLGENPYWWGQDKKPETMFLEQVWLQIPPLREQGVNGALLNDMADWAATIWPDPGGPNHTERTWASLKSL